MFQKVGNQDKQIRGAIQRHSIRFQELPTYRGCFPRPSLGRSGYLLACVGDRCLMLRARNRRISHQLVEWQPAVAAASLCGGGMLNSTVARLMPATKRRPAGDQCPSAEAVKRARFNQQMGFPCLYHEAYPRGGQGGSRGPKRDAPASQMPARAPIKCRSIRCTSKDRLDSGINVDASASSSRNLKASTWPRRSAGVSASAGLSAR